MKYMRSKRKIAKEILEIILKNRKENQYYVEPFCGGCNSLDKVSGKRIACDNNKYLIALLKEMQKDNLEFPFIGEKEYQDIKNNKNNYPDWVLGYARFQLSFGAKWFGGYRRDKAGIRDYQNEAQQNLIKAVDFYNCNYWELKIPDNSIVYCDPPYEGTTKYKDKFDHDKFWKWCNDLVNQGHTIFVSEYHAPENWRCVWGKKVITTLDINNYKENKYKIITTMINKAHQAFDNIADEWRHMECPFYQKENKE